MPRLFVILFSLLFVLVACEAESSPDATAGAPGTGGPTGSSAATGTAEVVEITVGTDTGTANQFEPAEVTVPAGATVRLTFENRSSSVPHNLTVGEPIDVATDTTVDPGGSETIEFTAPDPGEYPFECTLHPGMEGTLVVEEA